MVEEFLIYTEKKKKKLKIKHVIIIIIRVLKSRSCRFIKFWESLNLEDILITSFKMLTLGHQLE